MMKKLLKIGIMYVFAMLLTTMAQIPRPKLLP